MRRRWLFSNPVTIVDGPNVLIVLLEYIDLFNPSDNTKQSFGRGCPVLYHSILPYSWLLQLTKCVLLKFAPIMPAFCSLLLVSYFSKNYAGKIGTSLGVAHITHKKSY